MVNVTNYDSIVIHFIRSIHDGIFHFYKNICCLPLFYFIFFPVFRVYDILICMQVILMNVFKILLLNIVYFGVYANFFSKIFSSWSDHRQFSSFSKQCYCLKPWSTLRYELNWKDETFIVLSVFLPYSLISWNFCLFSMYNVSIVS